MQDYRRTANFKCRIETGMTNLAERRSSNQWNNHSSTVFVELRGLDNYDKRNVIPMFAQIAMHVELGH